MKVALIGSLGMLAQDLLPLFENASFSVTVLGLPELHITRPERVRSSLATLGPELVINCAAYRAVDKDLCCFSRAACATDSR